MLLVIFTLRWWWYRSWNYMEAMDKYLTFPLTKSARKCTTGQWVFFKIFWNYMPPTPVKQIGTPRHDSVSTLCNPTLVCFPNVGTVLQRPLKFCLSEDVKWWLLQVFWWPMAFCIPPSVFFVHWQFNLLYQYWIHTAVSMAMQNSSLELQTHKIISKCHHQPITGLGCLFCIMSAGKNFLFLWPRLKSFCIKRHQDMAYPFLATQNYMQQHVLYLLFCFI